MTPPQPMRSAARAKATHSPVARPAIPAMIGARPFAASQHTRRISTFSSNVSVAASPSEPSGTIALEPLSIIHVTCRASASWSTE
jgi:hypothetical protein